MVIALRWQAVFISNVSSLNQVHRFWDQQEQSLTINRFHSQNLSNSLFKCIIYQIRADHGQKHASEAQADDGKYPFIPSTENLLSDETSLVVACVWATLMKQGKLFNSTDNGSYDFVHREVEDARGYRVKVQAAVNGPQDLIIPLVFTKDEVSPQDVVGEREERLRERFDATQLSRKILN
ncbi:MAG: hypothetical protein Q9222_002259 [Ikaeria aurantiellina]